MTSESFFLFLFELPTYSSARISNCRVIDELIPTAPECLVCRLQGWPWGQLSGSSLLSAACRRLAQRSVLQHWGRVITRPALSGEMSIKLTTSPLLFISHTRPLRLRANPWNLMQHPGFSQGEVEASLERLRQWPVLGSHAPITRGQR